MPIGEKPFFTCHNCLLNYSRDCCDYQGQKPTGDQISGNKRRIETDIGKDVISEH
jgi:hypothetical protein